jgi:amino acid adenylation domain-containing protein
MIVALLAVLKAGGAYVPLDPAYPVERLRFMLEDSAPVALLTQSHLRELFTELDDALPVLDLADAAAWQDRPQSNPEPEAIGLGPNHLAYVIYTSGSTGMPKGVMVHHRGVVNRLVWMQRAYELDPCDAVLQKTPFGFDVSVWEFFWTLFAGARLVMARPEGHKDPGYLIATIRRTNVTTMHFVPSMLQVFLEHTDAVNIPSMVRVVCSGEALPATLLRRFQELLPHAVLHNLYGPTEAAVDVTAWTAPSDFDLSAVPIGKPVANTQIYILDAYGQPVPVGVIGELYIGGVQVARGYLNRPELTAEKFLADPFAGDPEARMYKTGDLGRWLADGNIEFLGRNDFQVKIRGFRIELGEIESRLMEHAAVRESVVIAREDTLGDKRLIAYYTTSMLGESEQDAVSAEQLRSHLSVSLPEYMVPAAYVRLESLPLTPNGKLDRKALPAPESDAYSTRGYEAPQGEIEKRLAAIWAEVLKIERVGRNDNFFSLGGHSLLAVTLIERMRRNGFKVDVRTLFATPTLADLARAADAATAAIEVPSSLIPANCEAITPDMLPLVKLSQKEIDRLVGTVPGGTANVQDIYPLAPLQEGIFFHHLMGGEGDAYLLSSLSSVDTREHLDAFVAALQSVVNRHDILRTAVLWEGLSEPAQVVQRQAQLSVEEIELDPAAGDASQQLYARLDPRHHRIDLRTAPMLRASVAFDVALDRWLLLTRWHHLIGDHTTLEVIEKEIQAHLLGRADLLAASVPYRNVVAQARLGISQQDHEAFFRQMLGDVDEPTAPFGLLDVQSDGSGIEEAHLVLDDDLARHLRVNARRLGVSAASLCHLAWAQVLAKTSGHEDVVFGTVLFGRMQGGEGSDRGIGLFINTLPVRISVNEEGVEAAVRRTHTLLADLMRHEHASLALAQRCSAVPAPAPLFSALLNYRHSPGAAQAPSQEALQAWKGIEELRSEERTNYPFTLSVNDLGEGFSLDAQTPASIGPMRVCEYMRTALEALVEALETSPAKAIRMLDVLPAAELHRVLYEWNDTKTEYPSDKCVHQLFEEQVRKSPDATAVVFEDIELSYAELNRKANQLGHYLRALGVTPDDRVAICVERGFEMIVALLAVLKAGGAYVPLDPAYPVERLRFMLEDSAPVALLTQSHLRELFTELDDALPVLDLADAAAWQDRPQSNPEPEAIGLGPNHLAYVIYTSGSTGMPKGVMVHHQGLCNYLFWALGAYSPNHAVVSSSLSFDATVTSLYKPLLCGGTVSLLRNGDEVDGLFMQLQQAFGCGLVKLTPGHLDLLGQQFLSKNILTSATLFVVGGDALSLSTIRLWRQLQPQVCLVNEYGPTETVVGSTVYDVPIKTNPTQSTAPIGRPIANTRVYIVDAYGQPVPVGVTGELYIGGAGVSRGYLNRPELTAEKFVADPFADEPGARMYRTGDLGRWLADGNIEFLGRNDFQVKLRGFRIELGEIEARLAEHPAVREAVVMAREDTPGDKRLVAYYTPSLAGESGEDTLNAEELRLRLSACLPEYMVPAAYVRLESLPLTPNGKLDRKALPAPESDAYSTRGYEAPQGEIEEKLAAIWAEVLKLERVGRNDNFFVLGGHSLLAVRVITRLREELDVEVAIRDLFVHPVLADLACILDNSPLTMQLPITRIKRNEPVLPFTRRIITATASNGRRIASHDNGEHWYDLQTGKVIE